MTNKTIEKESMTYNKLHELQDEDKACIIETAYDGTIQLWEVETDGQTERYVVDSENDVCTEREWLKIEKMTDSDDPTFSYHKNI